MLSQEAVFQLLIANTQSTELYFGNPYPRYPKSEKTMRKRALLKIEFLDISDLEESNDIE